MDQYTLTDEEKARLYKSCPVVSELGEIRVLHLLPGLEHEEVHCRLSKTVLANRDYNGSIKRRDYEALSYTWGAGGTASLTLNDKRGFPVTQNLASALRRLRNQYKPRILWVDALCIHQIDLSERTGQVKLMGDIFSNAVGVLVWLGEVHQNNWMLPDEGHIIYETASGESRCYRSPEIIPQGSLDISVTEHQRCALHGVLHGTYPRWWERTWIVQEFCKAPTNLQICYGTFEEDYNDFFSSDGLLWQLVAHNGHDVVCQSFWSAQYRLIDIRSKVRQGPLTILDFVENCFQAAATDVRDKAYSLRSMISVDEARWIEPDYRASILSVFARATFASIVGSAHLGILRYTWLTASRDPTLPSWAVDFADSGLLPCDAVRTQLRGTKVFEALEPWADAISFPVLQEPAFDEVTGTLVLGGRCTDGIAGLAVFENCALVGDEPSPVTASQTRAVTSLLRKLVTIESPRDWSSLLTDSSKHRLRSVAQYLTDIFRGWYEASSRSFMTSDDAVHRGVMEYALFSATRDPMDATFFTTTSGNIGFVRSVVQAGDVITLFHGAPLPAVLRPIAGNGAEFSFLGFAIVTGLIGDKISTNVVESLDMESQFAIK